MCLATLTEKTKDLETLLQNKGADEPEKALSKIESYILNIESNIDQLEDAIRESIKFIESRSSSSFDYEKEQESAKELINILQNLIDAYEAEAEKIKSSKSLLVLSEEISPRLIIRMENAVEDLEDIKENIELGLKFHNEFQKLEPLLEKYAEKTKEIDLEKKVG